MNNATFNSILVALNLPQFWQPKMSSHIAVYVNHCCKLLKLNLSFYKIKRCINTTHSLNGYWYRFLMKENEIAHCSRERFCMNYIHRTDKKVGSESYFLRVPNPQQGWLASPEVAVGEAGPRPSSYYVTYGDAVELGTVQSGASRSARRYEVLWNDNFLASPLSKIESFF